MANPMEQFAIEPIIPIGTEAMNLSFTNSSLWMAIALVVIAVRVALVVVAIGVALIVVIALVQLPVEIIVEVVAIVPFYFTYLDALAVQVHQHIGNDTGDVLLRGHIAQGHTYLQVHAAFDGRYFGHRHQVELPALPIFQKPLFTQKKFVALVLIRRFQDGFERGIFVCGFQHKADRHLIGVVGSGVVAVFY